MIKGEAASTNETAAKEFPLSLAKTIENTILVKFGMRMTVFFFWNKF